MTVFRFDGKEITYDAVGNLLKIRIGTILIYSDTFHNLNVSYKCNNDAIRLEK